MGMSPSVRVHCEGHPERDAVSETTITQIQSAAYCKRAARSVGAGGSRPWEIQEDLTKMSVGVVEFGLVILKQGCGRKGRRARHCEQRHKENMRNCEQYRHVNRYVEQV